ncbi:hypothetical protein IGI37_002599 [Enterococcus sp. AZ194]|uniref:RNA-guided endonuclease InsQ/TnpB family protein n=1 Tax=Enterococcus sp. AZ194 TaxID=2774629 RepID=UPI003F265B10
MLVAYRTEILLTEEQKGKIKRTIGVARYVKNFYIAHNQEVYKAGGKFVSGKDFSKWLNNDYIPNNPDKSWIKEVYAKSTKHAIMETERAFERFFQGKANFPKFKKKKRQNVSMYFVKNDKRTIIKCERHRIKVPSLNWVRLKEKGYIPRHDEHHIIKSGTISQQADRYYLSVLVEQDDSTQVSNEKINEGIGIDLGIKDFAILSNGATYKNINKSGKIRKLEKQLKRQQRQLSRKYESEKRRTKNKHLKRGEATRKNIEKQVLKVQKLHKRLADSRNDKQNKIVSILVKTKPAYITIEDLNVKGMMKNRHLSKAVRDQSFYAFRKKLEDKCKVSTIELRIVDRFYPSSKLCHKCGDKKVGLKLSERMYHCDNCGYKADRDYNASLNLKDAKKYKVLA